MKEPLSGWRRHQRLFGLILFLLVLVFVGLFWWYPRLQMQRVRNAIADRRYHDAESTLATIESWSGETPEGVLLRARIARLRGDGIQMQQWLRKASLKGASPAEIQFETWLMQMQAEGQLPKGMSLPVIMNLYPSDSEEVLYAWIWGCAQAQSLREGERAAYAWVEEAKQDARAWYSKGRIDELMGRTKEAFDAFAEASKLQPSWIDARLAFADQLKQSDQATEAVKEYRGVLELSPQMPQAWKGLTESLVAAGETEAAEEEIKRWLAIQPKAYDAIIQLADIQLQRDDYTAALDTMQPLADSFAKDSAYSLLMYRAHAAADHAAEGMQWLGIYQEGEEAYAQYIQTLKEAKNRPLDAPTAMRLAEIIFPYRFREAIPWLQSAVSLQPDQARAYEMLAEAFDKQSRAAEADGYRQAAQALEKRSK